MSSRFKNKRIKKDYQSKSLKNPFFSMRKEGKTSLKWKWLILFFIICLGAIFWFFLAAPFWQIKNINIQGLTRINSSDIEKIIEEQEGKKRFLFFNESNFFLFDASALQNEVVDRYNFAGLEVRKILPDTLELKISERPYAFIFQEGSELFYTSSDGYIIKEIPVTDEDRQRYFILENKSLAVSINSRNKLSLRQEYLDFVFALDASLDAYPDLLVEKFIIDQEVNSLIVKFQNGPSALFNSKNDAREQVADLALVKKEKIKDNFSETNYIDLRYGSRIFIN